MQTRSSSKFVGEPSTNPTSTIPKHHNRRRSIQRFETFSLVETPVVTMADQRTMAELLYAPIEGYAKAIIVPPIPAEHFKLKHSLINLITATLKYKDVPETSIKLMLFPFSIDGPAQIWLDKEPSRSILTWDDLVSKFINHFFPLSKTTNLRNESSNFQQKFEETFSEAWDRFKDLLRACPHHDFTKLHQLDTFYNGLNPSDQDSLNSAAGGNLLERIKASNVDSSEIANAVASVVTSAITAMFKQHQVTPAPASVKAVEESCVTCGGDHSYRQCPATDGNTFSGYQDNIQGYVLAATANDAVMKNMQTQMTSLTNSNIELKNMFGQFMKMNTASTSSLGSLPSNTVANPRGDLKAITTRSGISYDRPLIPSPSSSLPKVRPINQSTTIPSGIAEDVFVKVGKFHFLVDFVVVDYVIDPRVPLILGRPFLRMARALIDIYGEELTLRVDDEAITFKVGQTSRYSYNNVVSINRIDVIDVACEEYAQEVLGFSNNSMSGNTTPSLDPILSTSSPSLTPFEEGDFILEEIKAWLTNDSIPPRIDDDNFDLEGDLLLLEKLLNDDPSSPLPPKELHLEELKIVKSFIDDPLELELRDLPSHLEYAFLEGTDKLPVIIAKDLKEDEKVRLLKTKRRPPSLALMGRLPTDACLSAYVMLRARRCMMAIFYDMIEETMEEKYHFMLKEGIVLGYKISKSRIEVGKAKVDVIAKLPHPTSVKGIRSFLAHALFYRRFIQDFSKIARPITRLLEKDTMFFFSKECIESFNILKKKLTKASILVAPDWDLPFEIMCDASDYAVEKELLAVVYAFEKFRPYLVLSKTIVYTDHSALKYLLAKQDAKPRLLRWILLLQEFDVIIHDKKGAENLTADHLSKLENPHQSNLEKKEITETFPLETLGMVTFRGDSSDVFPDKKPLISSRLAIINPLGDIMVPTTPLKNSLIPDFIGLLFTEMPMTWSHGVTLVNVKAKSRNSMKCLKMQFKYARSLTCGASISWDRSLIHEVTSTFSWPLTTCQNELKQKRSPLTMPELWIAPDYEASRARGFVLRSLELQSLA
ncbi:reverse transcriptase domain-containing protein [Tanacetum coccineum]